MYIEYLYFTIESHFINRQVINGEVGVIEMFEAFNIFNSKAINDKRKIREIYSIILFLSWQSGRRKWAYVNTERFT